MTIAPQEDAQAAKASRWETFEEVAGRTLMLLWLFVSVEVQFGRLPAAFDVDGTDFGVALELAKALLMLAFSLLAIGLTLFRRPAKATLGGWEPRVTAVLGSYLLLAIPLFPSAHLGAAWSLAAIAVMTVGLLACVYCLAWLGRSYSIMATARKLVTEGPYRVVRHPLYAAEILLMIGVVMANLSPAAVIVAIVVVALLYRRMINEERILATAFPEYAAYARQVPRIVPRFRLRAVVLPAAPGR